MRTSKLLGTLALASACLVGARSVLAGAPVAAVSAVTVSGGTTTTAGDFMAGWQFNVTATSVSVNGLGVWDQGDDGLGFAHQVGIWSDLGVLKASVTVPSGTGSLLQNDFRIVIIPNVVLTTGTYRVGAYYPNGNTDSFVETGGTATTLLGIGYQDRASLEDSGGFVFPSLITTNTLAGDFGPTFTVDTALTVPAVVPLPSAFSAGLAGLVGVASMSLLRKRFAGV